MLLQKMSKRPASQRFISRLEIPENRLMPVIFFLTEQKEYRHATIESKILRCYQAEEDFFYSMEFSFNMNENDIIRTIKNMV